MSTEHLVLVGKGGVGKSTTAANLAAALAEAGKRVLLVGYDSGWNSTATLRGENPLLPLPDWGDHLTVPFYAPGFKKSLCIEVGELTAEGDAALAEQLAERLVNNPLIAEYDPEYVLHDVSWEPGESFRLPIAASGVVRMIAVTSADMGAIRALNEFLTWLNTVAAVDCRFGGVVVNNLSGPLYESIITDFLGQINATVATMIPHSLMMSVSDFYNQTLIESAPLSHLSFAYRKLARGVLEPEEIRRPTFMQPDPLKLWAVKWGEIIVELETGTVRDGSCI